MLVKGRGVIAVIRVALTLAALSCLTGCGGIELSSAPLVIHFQTLVLGVTLGMSLLLLQLRALWHYDFRVKALVILLSSAFATYLLISNVDKENSRTYKLSMWAFRNREDQFGVISGLLICSLSSMLICLISLIFFYVALISTRILLYSVLILSVFVTTTVHFSFHLHRSESSVQVRTTILTCSIMGLVSASAAIAGSSFSISLGSVLVSVLLSNLAVNALLMYAGTASTVYDKVTLATAALILVCECQMMVAYFERSCPPCS